MSQIGLVNAVREEITRHVEFGGETTEGKLRLGVGKEKLAFSIAEAVTSYIKREHWLNMRNYLVSNILG